MLKQAHEYLFDLLPEWAVLALMYAIILLITLVVLLLIWDAIKYIALDILRMTKNLIKKIV